MSKYKRIGDILISEGVITPEQLKEAVENQGKDKGKLGEVLIRLGYLTEEQIIVALSKQLGIPYVSSASEKLKPTIDQNLDELIPYDFAMRNLVIPLSISLNSLTVVLFDPLDLILLDNLKKLTGYEINPIVSTKAHILKGIEDFYGRDRVFRQAMGAASGSGDGSTIQEIGEEHTDLSLDRIINQAEEAPVVKLVDLIIRQAIQESASDIHIEPGYNKLTLRYRIDGVLYEMTAPPPDLYKPIISRIKILSKMDIAEKRLPQDGGFMVKTGDRLIDLRVSSLPTIYGEKIVIRILDKMRVPLDLSKLGFLPQELVMIRKGMQTSYGLILLTGPTGSGKSTTLYSLLNELNSPGINTLTAEDPVEYRMDGIAQVAVKSDIGLTFANILRCFMRQDPDIILIGEIRDLETAEMCVRASLTGHLVLSTLHTNDAASSIIRLVDIGIASFLVSSSLRLIVTQRLLRKLCPHCKEPFEVKAGSLPKGVILNSPICYKPKGCDKCNFIGYKGRSVIVEVILVDDDIKEALYHSASPKQIMDIARKKGTLTLLESGLKRVEEGITSLEEVFSVTGEML